MENNLVESSIFFFSMSGFIVVMALGVLLSSSSIKALLQLVLSMLGIGLLFMAQGAVFLGGVQLAVYAGAVMILFLMVLMLVDLSRDNDLFFQEKASLGKFFKVGSVGVILGLSMGALSLKTYSNSYAAEELPMAVTKKLSKVLFLEHMFLFEVIGILLFVIAVAVVAASRVGGGNK